MLNYWGYRENNKCLLHKDAFIYWMTQQILLLFCTTAGQKLQFSALHRVKTKLLLAATAADPRWSDHKWQLRSLKACSQRGVMHSGKRKNKGIKGTSRDKAFQCCCHSHTISADDYGHVDSAASFRFNTNTVFALLRITGLQSSAFAELRELSKLTDVQLNTSRLTRICCI